MEKFSRIFIFFTGFVFMLQAAGAVTAIENPAMAEGPDCKPRKEASCPVQADLSNLKPVVRDLKYLIDEDPIVRMYFTQMIEQVPGYYGKNPHKYPGPYRYLKSIDQMLCRIDAALDRAPEYNDTDLVGFPINGILNWTMGTPAGSAVYRMEKVNAVFRNILREYTAFLNSKESLCVLKKGTGSWRSQAAIDKLNMPQYKYSPDAEYWGFTSWNDFFIREFDGIEKMRPLAGPADDSVIVSAADSEIFNIAKKVNLSDSFWVKAQPYSLNDMLAGDEYAKEFIGGDIYQAFLAATKYHRWHSPVTGKVVKAYIQQGTYYSAAESEGMDSGSPDLSQGYIAHVATRAIIFIKAKNPKIGLVAVMPIGMAEVSSCVLADKVKKLKEIKKGEELGYFQFGGSSHCLFFRPGVIKHFKNEKGQDLKKGDSVNVRQQIAITY